MNGTPSISEPGIDISWPAPDVALVVLTGEHDLSSAGDLKKTFDESLAAGSHLIVNLSPAEFIDSSTIAAFVGAKRSAEAADKKFTLVLGTAAIVERALEVSGVLEILEVVPTVEAALAD